MTKFEVIRKITGVKEFSNLVYALAIDSGSPEKLAEELGKVLTEEELRTIESVAQSGNYPLSFEGRQ